MGPGPRGKEPAALSRPPPVEGAGQRDGPGGPRVPSSPLPGLAASSSDASCGRPLPGPGMGLPEQERSPGWAEVRGQLRRVRSPWLSLGLGGSELEEAGGSGGRGRCRAVGVGKSFPDRPHPPAPRPRLPADSALGKSISECLRRVPVCVPVRVCVCVRPRACARGQGRSRHPGSYLSIKRAEPVVLSGEAAPGTAGRAQGPWRPARAPQGPAPHPAAGRSWGEPPIRVSVGSPTWAEPRGPCELGGRGDGWRGGCSYPSGRVVGWGPAVRYGGGVRHKAAHRPSCLPPLLSILGSSGAMRATALRRWPGWLSGRAAPGLGRGGTVRDQTSDPASFLVRGAERFAGGLE